MKRPRCCGSNRGPLRLDLRALRQALFLLQAAHPHLYYSVLDQLLCGWTGGHADCLVAHQRLCGLQINAGHNQSGTECVSQIMPSPDTILSPLGPSQRTKVPLIIRVRH